MSDQDIVTGLRTDAALFGKMPPHAKVNMNPEFMREMSHLWIAAANEIERFRAERDEARRMYCVMRDGEDGLNCREWADRKNWDCFKENTND